MMCTGTRYVPGYIVLRMVCIYVITKILRFSGILQQTTLVVLQRDYTPGCRFRLATHTSITRPTTRSLSTFIPLTPSSLRRRVITGMQKIQIFRYTSADTGVLLGRRSHIITNQHGKLIDHSSHGQGNPYGCDR
jgi:hypothetical protein